MLNRAEYNQLMDTHLSHIARTLYMFYLQPYASRGLVIIDIVDLIPRLQSQSIYFPFSPSSRDIENALNELEAVNLICNTTPPMWDLAKISFPLYSESLKQVPIHSFNMYSTWTPGPSFAHIAL